MAGGGLCTGSDTLDTPVRPWCVWVSGLESVVRYCACYMYEHTTTKPEPCALLYLVISTAGTWFRLSLLPCAAAGQACQCSHAQLHCQTPYQQAHLAAQSYTQSWGLLRVLQRPPCCLGRKIGHSNHHTPRSTGPRVACAPTDWRCFASDMTMSMHRKKLFSEAFAAMPPAWACCSGVLHVRAMCSGTSTLSSMTTTFLLPSVLGSASLSPRTWGIWHQGHV